MQVTLQVISNDLSGLSTRLRKEASKGVRDSAKEGTGIAKQFAPVDTGELQGEIHQEDGGELDSDVVSDTDHSLFQEFGTVKQPGTPYMTPMAEAMTPKFISRMSEVANKAANG